MQLFDQGGGRKRGNRTKDVGKRAPVDVGVKSHAFYTRPSHSARRLVGYGGCVL